MLGAPAPAHCRPPQVQRGRGRGIEGGSRGGEGGWAGDGPVRRAVSAVRFFFWWFFFFIVLGWFFFVFLQSDLLFSFSFFVCCLYLQVSVSLVSFRGHVHALVWQACREQHQRHKPLSAQAPLRVHKRPARDRQLRLNIKIFFSLFLPSLYWARQRTHNRTNKQQPNTKKGVPRSCLAPLAQPAAAPLNCVFPELTAVGGFGCSVASLARSPPHCGLHDTADVARRCQ